MASKLRVMVVDDDVTTLEVTAAVLEQRGYELIQRNSAIGTTLAILRDQPDVVLLDVNMPGLSGDRLAKLVPVRRGQLAPLIILCSGSPHAELELLARRCGAGGVIEKTGNSAEFVRRFDEVVAAHVRCAEPSRQQS